MGGKQNVQFIIRIFANNEIKGVDNGGMGET